MKRLSTLGQFRNAADKKLQELGMEKFKVCEVCGKPMYCLHHFFPKSVSSFLRYCWANLIPICQGCHMRHHQAGDPTIHGTIIKKRGQEWYNDLEKHKRDYIKVNKEYYKCILTQLENEQQN